MHDFHSPVGLAALILALFVGWWANTMWDEIVGRAQYAADTATGRFAELVHWLGFVALAVLGIGVAGLSARWWV